MPWPGERPTCRRKDMQGSQKKERILLPKEKYFDADIQEM